MRLVRQDKLQWFDQMGGDTKQHFALGQRFANQSKFVVFEVTQSAMNQFRRPLRRVRSQVVFFDQHHRQAPTRRITSDTCAVDPAANNEEINGLGGRL